MCLLTCSACCLHAACASVRLAGAVILEHALLAFQQWMARRTPRNKELEIKLLMDKVRGVLVSLRSEG